MDATPSPDNDTSELQVVLTRYVDSSRGYQQAAELMKRPGLSAALEGIAARRVEVAKVIACLIQREGEQPEEAASIEGMLHRWWIRFRETITEEEVDAVLGECIRGEMVLVAALERALDSQEITAGHAKLLRVARDEVQVAIKHFQSALGT